MCQRFTWRTLGNHACVKGTGKQERQRGRLRSNTDRDSIGQPRGCAGEGADLGGGSSVAEVIPKGTTG